MQMRNMLLIAVTIVSVCAPYRVGAQNYLQLTQPISGRAMRASSADPDWDHGSADYRSIAPGESLLVADLAGPGVITHLWMTFANQAGELHPGNPRDLWLKCYWDDETTASVEAPVGDFFAAGNGQLVAVDSAMVQIGGKGTPRAYNCYWPMPFAGRARIVLENHSTTETMTKVYYHADWIKYAVMPANTCYFHARFRMARPLPAGTDFTIADINGKGHYVGTVFSYFDTPGADWGEGDDRFFIDGELNPSVAGTGMEDYFGESWGFHAHNSLYHGYAKFTDGASMYRWHVLDPIPFEHSLRLTFENWGGTNGGYPFEEKTWTEWSAVGFWYEQPVAFNVVGRDAWPDLK
ncbi:DUF2961 domain-containing protein [bacterium]|nr:DUF2961 domain-containing protein [bacterium]